ncbi:MAG: PqqD family protein [Bacteroides sp.]|nr:PqqD family protein [Bacteroides sp.]
MHFNSNYILREIAGESLLVRQGHEGIDMTSVIALNPSGALLYQKFHNHEFTIDDLVNTIIDEYDIDTATASRDVTKWLNTLRQHNAISD